MSTNVVIPAIRGALPDFQKISNQPQWNAVKSGIGTLTADFKGPDFSTITRGVSSATHHFMDSFTRAQNEKQERAEALVGHVLREVSNKTSESLSLSSREQLEIKEEFSSSRDEHKENKQQIKIMQTTARLIQQTIGPALSDVLKSKIDPKTLDMFCKALKTSSRVATQVVPALRVLNNLSLAYEAAKVLYPEQINEIENHLTNAIQPHVETLEQGFSDTKQSVTSSLNQCKQDIINSLDEYEQQSKSQATEEPHKKTESEESLPSFSKK